MLLYMWGEFFTGWKKSKITRLRAFCYQVLILSLQLFIAFLSAKTMNLSAMGEISVWIAMSMFSLLAALLVVTVYCSMLIMTKRIRDLGFKYCFIITIFTFSANFCALKLRDFQSSQLMNHDFLHILNYVFYVLTIIWNLYIMVGKSK
ncbi:hypothetical protein L369_04748 [Enterobacter sp. MGH 23]|jgi:hypothetical protein|uniref:hypothetical protein n=1 Tax=Enterobacter cloacae complex TaxID=354276 RepID=UPI0003BE2D3B|nr:MULTISPECIES: hypothetical protein [Enterobacter cloacae complex]ESN20207.1 hypothetical protein L369_04748 [Enterobacter sp. MGH 23]KZQ01267.1 hypothetical protein A3463_24150 [Enterobacter chengduensis]MDK9986168.1 hypothetical protein [Enterobacter asburiae]MDK9995376.1 hypothetical protein [Enterobacter asburiae]